jgi:hypothetical protein
VERTNLDPIPCQVPVRDRPANRPATPRHRR